MAKQLPEPMVLSFGRFPIYVREEIDLLSLVASALVSASRQKKLAQSLYEYRTGFERGVELESIASDRDNQVAFAEAAKEEVERGFPKLCAHVSVSIWGTTEVLIEDTLVAALVTDISKADSARLDRIRLPFGQFERVDREERIRAAVGQILQDEGARGGITRFENALAVVSLSGPVDESDSRDLWELQNVRNVIVHKAGLADRRLIDACPWLNLKPSDPVNLSMQDVHRYAAAAVRYGLTVKKRAFAVYGIDVNQDQPAARA